MFNYPYFFYLLLLATFMSGCQPKPAAPAPITAEETEAAKALIQGSFDDLWGGLDSTKILDYHTEDFFILEQGEYWTNNEIKDYMRRSLERGNVPKRVNRMEYINVEKHGGAISISYNNFAEFYLADTLAGKAQWMESALAIPTEQGWRLRMMHSTRVNR